MFSRVSTRTNRFVLIILRIYWNRMLILCNVYFIGTSIVFVKYYSLSFDKLDTFKPWMANLYNNFNICTWILLRSKHNEKIYIELTFKRIVSLLKICKTQFNKMVKNKNTFEIKISLTYINSHNRSPTYILITFITPSPKKISWNSFM